MAKISTAKPGKTYTCIRFPWQNQSIKSPEMGNSAAKKIYSRGIVVSSSEMADNQNQNKTNQNKNEKNKNKNKPFWEDSLVQSSIGSVHRYLQRSVVARFLVESGFQGVSE